MLYDVCVSHSAVSNSLQPHGLQLAGFLCPWDSPGKNTGVGCHSLPQGILPTWARECCCHTRLRLTIEHVHSALRHPHSGPTGGREQQWITGLTLPTMIWLSLWIKEAEGKAGMGRSPWSSDSKPLLYGPFSHQTSLRPYKSKQKKKLKISRQWLGSTKPRLWDPSEYRVFVVRHYGAGPTSNIGMNIFQQLLSLGCDLFDFPLSVKEDVSLGFGNVSRSPFLHIPPYGVL